MVCSKLHAFVENMIILYFECMSTDRHVNIFHTKSLATLSKTIRGQWRVWIPARCSHPSEVKHLSPLHQEFRGQEALWMRAKMSSRTSCKVLEATCY